MGPQVASMDQLGSWHYNASFDWPTGLWLPTCMVNGHMAQTLARIIHDRALPFFYRDTMVALLPLVPAKDMGQLQARYADYEFQPTWPSGASPCSCKRGLAASLRA